MHFRHLDYPASLAIVEFGPAALDDLLDRGDHEAWRPIAREIARDPFGDLATTVLQLCDAHPMYGTCALWRHWIHRRRHATDQHAQSTMTLAQLRARSRMTQSQVGARLGISQADVSKLERRRDVRLSTLQEYARALGATLRVVMDWPDQPDVAVRMPSAPTIDQSSD